MTELHKVSLTCVLLGSLVLISSPASAETRSVVAELFTSQGCSSCPPADALLGELARRDDVIALGFHISYWDGLAWKDPFSSQSSTDRQRAYARLFDLGQVYTPQMVVDGAREMVGSDRAKAEAALHDARPETFAPVTFAADRRSVTIGAGDGQGSVLLVRFALERTTRVAGGENAVALCRTPMPWNRWHPSATGTGRCSASLSSRRLPARVLPCWFRRPVAECSAQPRYNESVRGIH